MWDLNGWETASLKLILYFACGQTINNCLPPRARAELRSGKSLPRRRRLTPRALRLLSPYQGAETPQPLDTRLNFSRSNEFLFIIKATCRFLRQVVLLYLTYTRD